MTLNSLARRILWPTFSKPSTLILKQAFYAPLQRRYFSQASTAHHEQIIEDVDFVFPSELEKARSD